MTTAVNHLTTIINPHTKPKISPTPSIIQPVNSIYTKPRQHLTAITQPTHQNNPKSVASCKQKPNHTKLASTKHTASQPLNPPHG
jgi:hypothetical protein